MTAPYRVKQEDVAEILLDYVSVSPSYGDIFCLVKIGQNNQLIRFRHTLRKLFDPFREKLLHSGGLCKSLKIIAVTI